MRTLIFIFCCLVFWVKSGFGQKTKLKQGYVITLQGDTIRGWISDKDTYKTPKEVWVKNQKGGIPKVFQPKDIKGYFVSPNKVFITYETAIKGKPTTIFLRKFVSGYISVYHFNAQKEKLYLSTADSLFRTINFEDFLTFSSSYFKEEQKWVQQQAKRGKPQKGYNQLIDFVVAYNNKISSTIPNQILARFPRTQLSIGAKLAGSYGMIRFRESGYYGQGMFEAVVVPTMGISVTVNEGKRFALGVEFNYLQQRIAANNINIPPTNVPAINTNTIFNFPQIEIPLYIRFVLSKNKIAPYCSMGLVTDILLNPSREEERNLPASVPVFGADAIGFNNAAFGGMFGGGIKYELSENLTLFFDARYLQTIARFSVRGAHLDPRLSVFVERFSMQNIEVGVHVEYLFKRK